MKLKQLYGCEDASMAAETLSPRMDQTENKRIFVATPQTRQTISKYKEDYRKK